MDLFPAKLNWAEYGINSDDLMNKLIEDVATEIAMMVAMRYVESYADICLSSSDVSTLALNCVATVLSYPGGVSLYISDRELQLIAIEVCDRKSMTKDAAIRLSTLVTSSFP